MIIVVGVVTWPLSMLELKEGFIKSNVLELNEMSGRLQFFYVENELILLIFDSKD